MPLIAAFATIGLALWGDRGGNEQWRGINLNRAPTARHGAVAVWTGAEMFVWGGWTEDPRSGEVTAFSGAGSCYDPATDSWRTVSTSGAPAPRGWHSVVWTGREVIVWGGQSEGPALADGAAYEPTLDRWRPLSRDRAPAARAEHAAVWTGTEMVILGGADDDRAFADGGAYNPGTDTWRPVGAASGLTGARAQSAVWTGTEVVLFGGINGARVLRQGARYNPAQETWSPLSMEGAPTARAYAGACWTGSRILVWGGAAGVSGERVLGDGAAWDPATNRWAPLNDHGAPAARSRHATAFVRDSMLVWGGAGKVLSERDRFLADGARLDLHSGEWHPLPTAGAPAPRCDAAAVWSGASWVVWGGSCGTLALASGARLEIR